MIPLYLSTLTALRSTLSKNTVFAGVWESTGNVRAIKNGLWNALASSAGAVTGVVGSILIVRSLTRADYGTFSYYLWLASILSVLGTLAFPTALTKITSELRGNERQGEANILSRWASLWLLGINLLLSAGMMFWAYYTSGPQRIYLLIVSTVLGPNALMAILRSSLWGQERYKPVTITVLIGSLLQLALIVVAYLFAWGVPGFLAALLSINISQAIGFALILSYPFNSLRPSLKFLTAPAPAVLRRYFAFAVPATLVMLYEVVVWQRSEIFFLERLSNLEQVGFYNLAYTIFGTLLAVGWALVHGFYPAISRDYGAGEWFQIREKMRQGLILACLFTVPLSFGGWATLPSLTQLLYSPKMLPMAPVAQVLLMGLLPGVITGMFGFFVNAVGGIWLQVRLGVVLSLVSIGLNLLLIPSFGAIGGAISSTATQFIYTLLLVTMVWQRYNISLPWRPISSIVAVGALTTLLVPLLMQTWLSGALGLVSAIILAAGTYMIAIRRLGYPQSLRTSENALAKKG